MPTVSDSSGDRGRLRHRDRDHLHRGRRHRHGRRQRRDDALQERHRERQGHRRHDLERHGDRDRRRRHRLDCSLGRLDPDAGGRCSDNLTITAQDAYGNTATTYTGSKSLTFTGATASPGGGRADRRPTPPARRSTSAPRPRSPSLAGCRAPSGSKNGAMKLYKRRSATIPVSRRHDLHARPSDRDGHARRALTKFVARRPNRSPRGRRHRNLTIDRPGHLRQHRSPPTPAPTTSPSAGALGEPGGDPADGGRLSGHRVNFGTPTAIRFTAGVAAAASGATNGEMRLYKSGAPSRSRWTEGTIASAYGASTP